MKLDYAIPSAALADYISVYYLFEADLPELSDIERAGIAQFRVVLDGSASMHFPDGRSEAFLPATIFGPRSSSSMIIAKGPRQRMFGFGILPAGWARLFNHSAYDFADRIVPVDELLPIDGVALQRRLKECRTLDQMIGATEELRILFERPDSDRHLPLIRAIDDWLESGLAPDISALSAATGLSQRQIERRCRQFYGAPPKFLVRKYRALRSANAIANGQGDWKEFIDTAYYDQPHFIREIKEFVGMTPSAVRDHKSPLSTLAFGRSQMAGAVSPLVSGT